MTQVEYHLKLAFWYWCAANPSQYTPDSNLGAIWQAHQAAIPYQPDGVKRLYLTLMNDPVFQNCTAVHNLIPGEFYVGGDLQTVKQLFVRLLICEPPPVDPTSTGTLS